MTDRLGVTRRFLSRATVLVLALALLFSCGFISQAFAADSGCALNYETFETAVPHLDAESCPDASMNEKAFCRISVGNDLAHVFYFVSDGKQCLIKVETYDDEEMTVKFKKHD